mgnify:CR=1 FL=1
MKTFLKEVLLPLLIALCLAAFFKPVYMADGVCDYFLMWLCVGFPFGIRRMCLWLVPFGYGISGTVGIFALNIIIGGLIGGLALIVGLLLGLIHTIREIKKSSKKLRGFVSFSILEYEANPLFCCLKAGFICHLQRRRYGEERRREDELHDSRKAAIF